MYMQLSVVRVASEVILLSMPIAVEVAGAVCGGLFIVLSNSLSKSGRSGAQKPHRLLRLRNASTRWRSVAVVNSLHAGDAWAYVSDHPWCRSTRSAYTDCARILAFFSGKMNDSMGA